MAQLVTRLAVLPRALSTATVPDAVEHMRLFTQYVWVASLNDGAHPGHPAEKEAHIFVGSKATREHVSQEIKQFKELPDHINTGQSE
ncbi:MAG: hypothetical protein AAGD96_23845 [Chloroflexota bacterium]